jgi:hypothetical protein
MTAPTETDGTTAPTETVVDHRMFQEDDQVIAEESAVDLAGATTGETAEERQMVPEDDRDMPQGLEMVSEDGRDMPEGLDLDPADASDAESPPAVVPAPDAEPELTLASAVADDSTSGDERWHEILAMFVDDPRSSVELAAGLVDDSAEALVTFVQERQHALLSAWQGDDAGTEEMRIALQQYRTFWNRIEDLSREA